MRKSGQNGNTLLGVAVPDHGAAIRDFIDNSASITRYKGFWGRLRLSMRHLDEQEIADEIPAYNFDRVEELEKDQMVEDDIVMGPVDMASYKGESVRLVLSPKKEYRNSMVQPPPPIGCISKDWGWQVIYIDSDKASYLQLLILET